MEKIGGQMKYTVTWLPAAEADLTSLWIQALDRPVVTLAADHIETVLRINPYAHSEVHAGKDRLMYVGPLGIAYTVSDEDCLVTVWNVWRTDQVHENNNGQNHP
jgi:hypothetical protein